MRIIAGSWRGKKIRSPVFKDIRPTSDRARGALFNMLIHGKPARYGFNLQGASVLDVFAGTGALGLEALSRGARKVTFIENANSSIEILRANIYECGAQSMAEVLKVDAVNPPLARNICDLVFLDPPYGTELWQESLLGLVGTGWVQEGAICCVELGESEMFNSLKGFTLIDERRYGSARLLLLIYGS